MITRVLQISMDTDVVRLLSVLYLEVFSIDKDLSFLIGKPKKQNNAMQCNVTQCHLGIGCVWS